MALLEQVERRKKNRNEEDREWKQLSSRQVSWRGWNIKISVELTTRRKMLIVILTRYFLFIRSECLSFRLFSKRKTNLTAPLRLCVCCVTPEINRITMSGIT